MADDPNTHTHGDGTVHTHGPDQESNESPRIGEAETEAEPAGEPAETATTMNEPEGAAEA